MLGWFNTKEVDALADSVVADLRTRFPASGHEVQTQKDVQRVLKGVDRLLARVDQFARERRPNLYKKARFGNRVRWGLVEAQYPAEFAQAITDELVTHLTLASRR